MERKPLQGRNSFGKRTVWFSLRASHCSQHRNDSVDLASGQPRLRITSGVDPRFDCDGLSIDGFCHFFLLGSINLGSVFAVHRNGREKETESITRIRFFRPSFFDPALPGDVGRPAVFFRAFSQIYRRLWLGMRQVTVTGQLGAILPHSSSAVRVSPRFGDAGELLAESVRVVIAILGYFGFQKAAITAAFGLDFLKLENEPGGGVSSLKFGTPSILFTLCCSEAASRAACRTAMQIFKRFGGGCQDAAEALFVHGEIYESQGMFAKDGGGGERGVEALFVPEMFRR
jgi:hypothetical protein